MERRIKILLFHTLQIEVSFQPKLQPSQIHDTAEEKDKLGSCACFFVVIVSPCFLPMLL